MTDKEKEMLEFDSIFYEKSKLMRDDSAELLINLFVKPRINFIFGPHPVADPLLASSLAPSRNLTIL